MLEDDKSKVFKLIFEHFATPTDGDAQLVWDECRGENFEDCKRAIIQHRQQIERKGATAFRPVAERIRLLSAGYRADRARAAKMSERTYDWIIKNAIEAEGYRDAEPAAAVLMHYSNSWEAVLEKGDNEYGRRVMQAFILDHCRSALIQLGSSHSEADEFARGVVGLMPNERIPVVRSTRGGPAKTLITTELSPVPQSSYAAICDLAIASHIQQPCEPVAGGAA